MKTDRSVLKRALSRTMLGAAAVLTMGCGSTPRADESPSWTSAPPADESGTAADAPAARPLEIDIEQAVAEALAHNRTATQARLDTLVSAADVRESRSALIPQITGRGTYTRLDEAPQTNAPELGTSFTIGPREVYAIRFDANFPIFAFGKYWYAFKASQLQKERAVAGEATAEADIAAAVTAAAFDLLLAQRAVEVARSNETALARQVEDSQALLDAGRVTKAALLDAQVAFDTARRDREKRESAVPIVRMTLNRLLGRPVFHPTVVTANPVRGAPPWQRTETTVELLADEALTVRSELRAARLETAALRRGAKAVRGADLPELRGNLSWENNNSPFGNPTDRTTFLVTLDLPIFTAGARGARRDRARLFVDAAEVRLRELEAIVRTEVAEAYRAVLEAYDDIAVARRSITRSEESLRIQREKFRNGRATSREVLESTALLTNSRFAYFSALYDYNVALRDLHRARGLDPRASPFEGVKQPDAPPLPDPFDPADAGDAGEDGGEGDG